MFTMEARHQLPACHEKSFSPQVPISPGLDRELQGFRVAPHLSQSWSWHSLMEVDRANEGSPGWGSRLAGRVTTIAACLGGAFNRAVSLNGPRFLQRVLDKGRKAKFNRETSSSRLEDRLRSAR
jgi:hypothetical protein